MIWKVSTPDQEIELDAYNLINMILPRKEIGIDHKHIGYVLAEQLLRGSLMKMTLPEILSLGIYIGYNYKIFLSKNKVTMDESTLKQDSDIPSSQSDS